MLRIVRIFSLMLCACAVGGIAHARNLAVSIDRDMLVKLRQQAAEVLVSNPDIAGVVVHNDKRHLSVIGKKLGTTNVRALNDSGRVIAEYRVQVGYDLPAIRRALSNFFPEEAIGVEIVNDNIALTGIVTDLDIARNALKVVNEFINEKRGTNREDEITVLNLAKVRSSQQVMLRVRVGEIKRTTLKNLGVNFNNFTNVGNFLFSSGVHGGIFGLLDGNTPGALEIGSSSQNSAVFGVNFASNSVSLNSALEMLEENGLFKTLAEPNLVAVSGEEAEFLAGGEFPIPISSGNDSVYIDFKAYGVAVKFIPFVLSENRVRLIVKPEVSELSDEAGGTLNGLTIPSISTRRAKTTIELAPGEGFMIAGLLQDQLNTSLGETPGLAEIPFLSSLFRRSNFRRTETELVIAVTPYLVDPVVGSDIRMPSDNYRAPSVMEQFFYGALGSMSRDASRISQTPQVEGPIGFLVD